MQVLHQIVVRACLERRDGDLAVLRGGDKHHRRRIGNRENALQRLQPVRAGHVLIQRHHVDATGLYARNAIVAAVGMNDVKSQARQATIDQPRKGVVVVDIQKAGFIDAHISACGT